MSEFYSLTQAEAEKHALVVAYHEDKKLVGARGLLIQVNNSGDAFLFSNTHKIMELPLTYCMTISDYEKVKEGAIIRPHRNKAGVDGLILVHD